MPSQKKVLSSRELLLNAIPYIVTLFIVTIMAVLSDTLSERSVLIPEIAALSFGILLSPQKTWQESSWRTFVSMAISGLIGLGIVLFFPVPYWLQIVFAFAIAQIAFLFLGASLPLMISAAILPVMLQVRSPLYLLSLIVFTVLILLFHALFVRFALRGETPFIPHALSAEDFIGCLLRTALVLLITYGAVRLNAIYLVAPPLLFAFTELSVQKNTACKAPITTIVYLTLASLSGAGLRTLLCLRLHLPLFVSAAGIVLVLFLLIYIFGLYLPAAAAIALLALLIPTDALLLYPIQIVIGAAIFIFSAKYLFRKRTGFSSLTR